MSKKMVLASASVALVASAITGVVATPASAATPDAGTGITSLAAAVTEGKVKLTWLNSGDGGPLSVFRDGKLVSSSTVTETSTSFEDNAIAALPVNFPTLTDADPTLTVKTVDTFGLDATAIQALTNAYTAQYTVENSKGQSQQITVSGNIEVDEVYVKLVKGNAVDSAEFVLLDADFSIPASAIPTHKLVVKVKDTDLNRSSDEAEFLLKDLYTGADIPMISTIQPVIKTSEELTTKTLDVSFELPAEWANVDADIEYKTDYGVWTTYKKDSKIAISGNTYIEARILDGLGGTSITAKKEIKNVNPYFGTEYKIDLSTNELKIDRPEAANNIAYYEFAINDSGWRIYDKPVKVADGKHELQVRVIYDDGAISDGVKYNWNVGTAANTEEDPAQNDAAKYTETLANATGLVVTAETIKTQASIDNANFAFTNLTEADRLILKDRLDKVQEYVNSQEASRAVSLLNASDTVGNLTKALVAVGELSDGEVKKTLLDDITEKTATIIKGTKATTLNNEVEALMLDAETDPTKGKVYALTVLIPSVTDTALKAELQSRFTEVETNVKFKEEFERAERTLAKAEKAETKIAYDEAKTLIDKLPKNKTTEKMKQRLDRLGAILSVTNSEGLNGIVTGTNMDAAKLAALLKTDVPTSLVDDIEAAIKSLGNEATIERSQQVAELIIAQDAATRDMSAKSINNYSKLYTKYSSLSTINQFSHPQTVVNLYNAMSDDTKFESVIRSVAVEADVSYDKLVNYYNTIAPSAIAQTSSTAILSFDEIKKLDGEYSHVMFKSLLLAKQYLVTKEEVDLKAADTYADNLLNGEFKQSILSSIGATKADIDAAGKREDKVIKADGTTDKNGDVINTTPVIPTVPETEKDKEANTKVNDYVNKLPEGSEVDRKVVNDVLKGKDVSIVAGDTTVTFKANANGKYELVTSVKDGVTTVVLFKDGVITSDVDGKFTVEVSGVQGGKLVTLNTDGSYKFLNPIDTATGQKVTVDKLPLSLTVNKNSGAHTDLSSHWSNDYVKQLTLSGVMQDAFTFDPGKKITRGEFASYLASALGLHTDGASAFSDTANHKHAGAIAALANAGIVLGDGTGLFSPDGELSREQTATMMVRAMQYTGIKTEGKQPNFKDKSKISTWAAGNVGFLQSAGIFDGVPVGNQFAFNPNSSLTKAELAKVLAKSIDYINANK